MSSALRTGVFVDAENIRYNGGYQMRYDMLRRFAARNGGTLLRLNTYLTFDPQRAETDPEYLKKANAYQQRIRDFGWKVNVKHVKRFTDEEGNVTTKANSDLDMAVDALQQAANLDRVLLVTGDGDFLQVVNALQSRGCRVDLLAFRNVSRELQRQVDEYIPGYLIPDLLPFPHEPKNQWGTVGSCVRGVCSKWFPDKGYGFFRYLNRMDGNLWISDPREPDSPWESVFCHIHELPSEISVERLASRDTILEFYIKEGEHGRAATAIRQVS